LAAGAVAYPAGVAVVPRHRVAPIARRNRPRRDPRGRHAGTGDDPQRAGFHRRCIGEAAGGIAGWKARRHTDVIDVDRIGHYDPLDFFEPVQVRRGGTGLEGVVLDPNDFYILATREAVVVPPDHAAEMIPYDAFVGEFRVHFAGFFDPGFGSAEACGSGRRSVLEVRSHEVPFLIESGQVVGRLI